MSRLLGLSLIPQSLEGWFGLALWIAGIGHFCILGASLQAPYHLRWRDDLAKLSPFNRKLMWVYGAYTVFTIVAFGTLTFMLHGELLRGDRAALALAGFIGSYWGVRVLVDIFYYGHAGWPKGPAFVVGHVLLLSLFCVLAGTYLGLVIWHVGSV